MPIQILMHISHMMNFYCRLEVTRTGSMPKKCSLFIYIYITQSLSFVKWASKLPLESLCFIYFSPNSINLIIVIITVSLKKGLIKVLENIPGVILYSWAPGAKWFAFTEFIDADWPDPGWIVYEGKSSSGLCYRFTSPRAYTAAAPNSHHTDLQLALCSFVHIHYSPFQEILLHHIHSAVNTCARHYDSKITLFK